MRSFFRSFCKLFVAVAITVVTLIVVMSLLTLVGQNEMTRISTEQQMEMQQQQLRAQVQQVRVAQASNRYHIAKDSRTNVDRALHPLTSDAEYALDNIEGVETIFDNAAKKAAARKVAR
jgi:hypothetical protein